jgi:hypothetical protein
MGKDRSAVDLHSFNGGARRFRWESEFFAKSGDEAIPMTARYYRDQAMAAGDNPPFAAMLSTPRHDFMDRPRTKILNIPRYHSFLPCQPSRQVLHPLGRLLMPMGFDWDHRSPR